MKKLLSLILTLTLLLTCTAALASCGEPERVTMHIGVMSGPTGMGMAKMMNDHKAEGDTTYVFDVYTNPQVAIGDLASGELDAVCLPTNTAAAQAKAKEDYISVVAVNTLGSLYLLTSENVTVTSLADLEGKTVYVSVPNSTTKPILAHLLSEAGVQATIEVEVDHDTLAKRMAEGAADRVDILVLPEPYVSKALTQNPSYSIDLNLSTEWSTLSEDDLAMGCLVVRNEFLKANESTVQAMLKEYRDSINFIANPDNLEAAAAMIVEQNILGALPLAKKALTNLRGSIVYRDGDAMKQTLISFYTAIGLAQPTDDFYYAGIKENG